MGSRESWPVTFRLKRPEVSGYRTLKAWDGYYDYEGLFVLRQSFRPCHWSLPTAVLLLTACPRHLALPHMDWLSLSSFLSTLVPQVHCPTDPLRGGLLPVPFVKKGMYLIVERRKQAEARELPVGPAALGSNLALLWGFYFWLSARHLPLSSPTLPCLCGAFLMTLFTHLPVSNFGLLFTCCCSYHFCSALYQRA